MLYSLFCLLSPLQACKFYFGSPSLEGLDGERDVTDRVMDA